MSEQPVNSPHVQSWSPESRWRLQNQMLVKLARQQNLLRSNFTATLQEIAQAAAETLAVERTSIWLYNLERTQIHCLELYERRDDRHSQGSELYANLYPAYFQALEEERTIAADDALHDRRTLEFAHSYLTPLGITAMLDAPIWSGGQMVGVVCHEQIGSPRHWTLDEQLFAAAIADLVSLSLEARERSQTEVALRLSEERLQSFFNATFEAVVIHDRGRILDVNHATETMFGYTSTELVGMMAMDLAPPEMHPILIERIRHPQDTPTQLTGLRKDGTLFRGEIASKSITYQGQPARVVSIRDVTQREQAQEALRASEERLQSFFNATFEAVVIHDQGRILDVNHAAESMFGYSTDELIGMNTLQLAPPAMHEALIERTLRPQGGVIEATGLRKDSSTFIGELSTKAISYQGQPAQVVSIRDITKRKQAEAALEALNASLEQQVAERTAQLQQQMQELKELNHLKDVFLHAVSHDLRTPVMGSLLVLNNLLHPPGIETPAEMPPAVLEVPPAILSVPRSVIERMIASCERQQALIDSLLETHASEVSGLQLHCQPTHFLTLVEDILADLEPLLTKSQARVKNQIPPNLPLLPVDITQLQRVYENLVTNALKHNPPGLTLTLDARCEEAGQHLLATIQDNGVGISADQTPQLFDLYFRGSRSLHRKGIGLGLYLCRQIVEAHGGSIGVQSQPGRGATFWLKLPLVAPDPSPSLD